MGESKLFSRGGSILGSKHRNLHVNNQDALCTQSFSIKDFGKNYQIGLVSDGCTGNPMFSHTEVGSNLLVVYAFRRIQNIICAGTSMADVPKLLFPSITEFILILNNLVMPDRTYWPYPVKIKGRENWSSSTRFRTDYLAATLIGFVSDGTDCVIFSAGDGIIMINNELQIIDQNDEPDYPMSSIDQPGKGFFIQEISMKEVDRLLISTDGLKKFIGEKEFVEQIYSFQPESILGLQFLLNINSEKFPEKMTDDCTAVTLKKT